MPLVYRKAIKQSHLLLWEITEDLPTIEQLANSISFDEKQYAKLLSKRRKAEWLISRILLAQFDPALQISYNEHKQPLLNDKIFISISHSQNMVGIYLGKNSQIGIDIEKMHRKVDSVASKFIAPEEFDIIKNFTKSELLLHIWCSKEVVFKAAGLDSIDFKKNILVKNIEQSSNKIKIECRMKKGNFNQNYHLEVIEVNKNLVAYTV